MNDTKQNLEEINNEKLKGLAKQFILKKGQGS